PHPALSVHKQQESTRRGRGSGPHPGCCVYISCISSFISSPICFQCVQFCNLQAPLLCDNLLPAVKPHKCGS
ncbi:hypothetical protein DPEC_G00120090, partial [Dallia pectoralis]